jgi:hypothetical protein
VAALADHDGPRRVLLFTDGKASGNRLGIDEVAQHAQALRVSIYIVLGRDTDERRLPELSPSVMARRLTDATGGLLVTYQNILRRNKLETEGPSVALMKLMRDAGFTAPGS